MDGVVDVRFATKSDKQGSDSQTPQQENLVIGVYSSVDEAANCELNRLYVEEGIVPTCKTGCYQCCGHHIVTNIAEAKALTQYIQHQFSPDQIEDLRIRTQHWHEWDKARPERPNATQGSDQNSLYTHHYCPMLVEGECSAYPVRPLVCRRHFVSSNPPACRPFYDSESKEGDPVALTSIITVTNQFSLRIKELIEKAGLNFYGSIMLLPHWLAIEMSWDFAINPQSG